MGIPMAKRKSLYSWAPVTGSFDFASDQVTFNGGTVKYGDESGPALGTALCDQWFGGGSISADLLFEKPSERSSCGLLLFYNPTTRAFLFAGLSNEALYGICYFDSSRWQPFSAIGDPMSLKAAQKYHVEVKVRGSLVSLLVNEVEVSSTTLPAPLPRTQTGIWCRDHSEITVRNFKVETEPAHAFVVMQFSSPYDELYREVVKPICAELGIDAIRADETYGPGLIIADVVRQIDEANLVIAEITPSNPNVYYELGYAHARGKPTVLIADREIEKLPFDVSPFRTLFYENSIDGKRRIEDGLRKHIKAILDPSGATAV